MPYIIITRDKADSLALRTKVRDVHLAYLDKHKAKLLAAGALTADNGTGGEGGVIIYDTEDRAEAEAFIAGDPFTEAELFESVTVKRWRKAFFNGERLV
ncbi:YciI family protein [Oceanibacterium hippocampi]|uniref:YciI-like protein n=1 Tax=Oceanibacterium hippocampi TaxID=745714 RepID=A0A1Y5TXL2_9PROT|nr:YciI family protein [Oceanibacterium hippocampi]SLN76256.1 YciI-like protein [Oceanibacterium hippocampi]